MRPEPDTSTYRGDSLEQLLPRIREELGSEAVIVRQREGIVGGIGGFFGRKCVEVDARPALVRPSVPPRRVIDAYDTGQGVADDLPPLLEALMAQTSPFAEPEAFAEPAPPAQPSPAAQPSTFEEELAEALGREPLLEQPPAEAAPAPPIEVEPPLLSQSPLRFDPPQLRHETLVPRRPAPSFAPRVSDDPVAVRRDLVAAGVPGSIADEIVREVDLTMRPFEPSAPYGELARRALARRLKVARGWRTKRRTIAVVGLPGSGRTLTASKLCSAYAASGRSVAALSLEQSRKAMRLAELTEELELGFEVAPSPDLVDRAKRSVRGSEIVIVDTPPLAETVNGEALALTLSLLGALKPDETHLLLPVRAELGAVRGFLATLRPRLNPSHLLLTHADVQTPNGVGVGVSLAQRMPVSFVADGDRPSGGLQPAEPDALARMVLQ